MGQKKKKNEKERDEEGFNDEGESPPNVTVAFPWVFFLSFFTKKRRVLIGITGYPLRVAVSIHAKL